jgi:hypothetical protein
MPDLLRPYIDLPDVFKSLEYRSNQTHQFEPVAVESGVATKVVVVDDLRTIPTHQVRIGIDQDRLGPYKAFASSLRCLILVRDAVLRREVKLADFSLESTPDIIELSRKELALTSLKTELTLNCVIVNADTLPKKIGFPQQLASRLAEFRLHIKNSAGGASFPFKRKSAEEMKAAGLPAEAGLYLHLEGDASELIQNTDTPVKNLLSFWVHERIWQAIQNEHRGNPATGQLRVTLMTVSASQMLLSAALPALSDGKKIEENSVIGQLLSYVEIQASLQDGFLLRQFEKDRSTSSIEPYLQHAWRFVSGASKEDEGSVS